MRLVIGISGATGIIYGIRILQFLHDLNIETHLVMTPHARLTMRLETSYHPKDVEALASVVHNIHDVGASIASGSYRTDGMIVIPCSVKTLSGIVNGYAGNLLIRAADVTLKEQRRLVLVFREAPLHLGHLRLLMEAAQMGATIFPPMPSFYNRPQTIGELVDQTVGRILDLFGIDVGIRRWEGTSVQARHEE